MRKRKIRIARLSRNRPFLTQNTNSSKQHFSTTLFIYLKPYFILSSSKLSIFQFLTAMTHKPSHNQNPKTPPVLTFDTPLNQSAC